VTLMRIALYLLVAVSSILGQSSYSKLSAADSARIRDAMKDVSTKSSDSLKAKSASKDEFVQGSEKQADSTVVYNKGEAVDTIYVDKKESVKSIVDDGVMFNKYVEIGERDKFVTRTSTSAQPLKRFGEDFLKSLQNNIPKQGPVNPSYRIGFGDEVSVSVWGEVQSNEQVKVDRSGKISLRGIGVISVAGRTVDELKAALVQRYSQIYSGVQNGKSTATTFVDVSMGELRTKQIYVVGNVVNPGTYNVPTTAGVLGALAFAGGPQANGSMREIIIKRGGKAIDTIDCYDYLLSGKINEPVALADMDVILVPTIKKRAAINGAVYAPGIFELTAKESFKDLIRYAGGYLPEAFTQNFNVTRTLKHNTRQTVSIFGNEIDAVQPNDSIVVPFVDEVVTTVTIEGAVKRPGSYGLYDGMTLRDLIKMGGGVSEDYFEDRAEVIRTDANFNKHVIAVKIGELVKGNSSENVTLQKWDIVKIVSKWDIQYRNYVSIYGEVKKPGKYFLREGMTIQDLILLAGGLTDKAYKDTVELSRIVDSERSAGTVTKSIPVTAGDEFYQFDSELLLHMDNVFVRENSAIKEQQVVYLQGEFNFPGHYAKLREDETLLSLIKRAGGLKNSAYLEGARFIRGNDNLGVVAINVKKLLENESSKEDIILENNDTLFVPTVPKTVVVTGAINYPTAVKFESGQSVKYYVQRAGGFTSNANTKSLYIILANGEVRQVKKNNKSINAGAKVVIPELVGKTDKVNWTAMASTMLGLAASSLSILIAINTLKK